MNYITQICGDYFVFSPHLEKNRLTLYLLVFTSRQCLLLRIYLWVGTLRGIKVVRGTRRRRFSVNLFQDKSKSACLFGRQVGLLVVRLLYRLYVCVHLSKWFTFSLSFGCQLLFERLSYHWLQRFRALRSGGFRSTKLSTSTELE
jgi:hypothetical protein